MFAKKRSKKNPSSRVPLTNFDILSFLGKFGLKTIKSKLFVSILVLTAFSILLTCLGSYISFRDAVESNEQMRKGAKAMAEAVDLLIYENIHYVRSIASDEAIIQAAEQGAKRAEAIGINKLPDKDQIKLLEETYKSAHVISLDPALNNLLDQKQRLKGVFDRAFFTDRYGLNVAMAGSTEDFVQSDEAWWQDTMRAGLYISDIEFDKPSESFSVEICVGIPARSGGWIGALKARYNLRDAQEYISRFRQFDSSYAYAVTANGRMVLHPDPEMRNREMYEVMQSWGHSDEAVSSSQLLNIGSIKDGGMLYYQGINPITKRQEERVAFYDKARSVFGKAAQFQGFGWMFVIDNSKAEVFAPAYRMLRTIILLGLLSLAVFAGLALVIVRSLSSKIVSLKRVTEEVSAGSLTARVNISTGDDLEEFSYGFNEMIDRLATMVGNERKQRKTIEESESNFRSMFDDAPVGYHEVDAEGIITRVNQTELGMLGYTADEMIGRHASEFALEATTREEIAAKLAGQEHLQAVERTYLRKDESTVPVLLEDRLIYDTSGNVTGLRTTIIDITSRKQMEKDLMDMKALFNSVLESLPQSIFCKDKDGVFTYANKAFCEAMGKQLDEIIGKADIDLYPQELAEKYRSDDARVIETRGVIDMVEENVSTEGTKTFVQVVKAPRYDFKGEVAGVQGIFWDVTERKQIEGALKESEEKYRSILENIEDGYYEVALNGDLIFFNDPVARILGYSQEECFGLNHKRYVRPDLLSDVQGAFNNVYRTAEPIREFAYEINRKDGSRGFVETSISLIKDMDGEATGFRGILRDVTDRRQAEAAMERSLKEFFELVSVVSEGDLTRRGSEGEEVLGRVVQSINKMLDNFSAMVTQVKQIGLSVSSSATEILAASEQIAAGSQRQADEITNTSSAVEEMAASMSQVSRNAEASAEAARRALEIAEQGDKSVRDTSEAMKRINSAVQQTAEKMRLLGNRSSEISEIIDLIDEIAAQTNLLALNAAIEAAHAGDAGLGFSVVAEEIRKLAERSARATRDVGSLIKAIQSETSQALSAMENGMSEVKGGSLLAKQASKAIQNISAAVRQSSELIEEISAASEEQARVTTNLAGAMQTISSITLETSAGAHQTAQTIQGMVGLSEQLNEAISQFKVKNNFVHPFSYDLAGAPPTRGGSGTDRMGLSQGD
jgi:PAS domain S-box-containing protein